MEFTEVRLIDVRTFLLLALLLIQVLIFFSLKSVTRRTDLRLPRLERKVDQVLRHLGVDFEDKAAEMVRPLLLAGKKIDAIKEYRRITGGDLKDAKEAVDAILLEMEQQRGKGESI